MNVMFFYMQAFVEEVMELVELTPLRLALVGLPGVTGLSTEQRKRLTIAVELVSNPSIIFMDEPTSGLDARAAAIVMRTVRNTVDTGRTVVCTIHQPSIDIFEAFDEVRNHVSSELSFMHLHIIFILEVFSNST
jgi:ABC-type multidrug transport system ATPase subunit